MVTIKSLISLSAVLITAFANPIASVVDSTSSLSATISSLPHDALAQSPDTDNLEERASTASFRLQYSRTGQFFYTMGVVLDKIPTEIQQQINGFANSRGGGQGPVSLAVLRDFLDYVEIMTPPWGRAMKILDPSTQRGGIFPKASGSLDHLLGLGIKLKTYLARQETIDQIVKIFKEYTELQGGTLDVVLENNDSFLDFSSLQGLSTRSSENGLQDRARVHDCPKGVKLGKYVEAIPKFNAKTDLAWAGECDGEKTKRGQ